MSPPDAFGSRRISMARRYSRSASKDVERVMKKRKKGTLRSGRSGFYLTVIQTGELAAGDSITLKPAGSGGKTISEVFAEKR